MAFHVTEFSINKYLKAKEVTVVREDTEGVGFHGELCRRVVVLNPGHRHVHLAAVDRAEYESQGCAREDTRLHGLPRVERPALVNSLHVTGDLLLSLAPRGDLRFGNAPRAVKDEHRPDAHLDDGGHEPPDSGLDLGVLSAAEPVQTIRKVVLNILSVNNQYVGSTNVTVTNAPSSDHHVLDKPSTLDPLFEKDTERSFVAPDESIDSLDVIQVNGVVVIAVGLLPHATPDRVPFCIVGGLGGGLNKGHQFIHTHAQSTEF